MHSCKNIFIDVLYLFPYLLGYITCKFHPARYTRNRTEKQHHFLSVLCIYNSWLDISTVVARQHFLHRKPELFSILGHISSALCGCIYMSISIYGYAFIFPIVACHHAHTKAFLTRFDTTACGWLVSFNLSHIANCIRAVPKAK